MSGTVMSASGSGVGELVPPFSSAGDALSMIGISKVFPGGIRANDDVTFCVRRGEIHALLGENGAGKSTLMNMLYGLVQPTGGEIRVDGQTVAIRSPKHAMALGIGMVHQHFKLFDSLTVAENIFFGCEPGGGWLSPLELNRRAAALCLENGLDVDPQTPIWQLPLGTRQRVELIRVMHRGAKTLILDEPTAVLTPQEASDLLRLLQGLAARGHSVILITHKLHEALEASDRVTVLRRGKLVQTLEASDTNVNQLARLMVDRDVVGARRTANQVRGELVLRVGDLEVKGDRGEASVDGCSFELYGGEVFAIAGVAGNGQSELVEALMGLRSITSGSIELLGEPLSAKSPGALRAEGFALVPDDRARYAMVGNFSVEDNLLLGRTSTKRFNRWGFLRRSEIEADGKVQLRTYDVRPERLDLPIKSLSGGNQQKVVLAREMSRPLRVLIVNEPTRGVDLGAAEFVRNKVLEQRAQGAAVLLVSSDLDEVLALSDRIGVMYGGKLIGVVPAESANLQEIGRWMGGAEKAN